MQVAEKKALEEEVWSGGDDQEFQNHAWEAQLGSGDGLFIPKGWWHSVKGVGEGMTGSVRWRGSSVRFRTLANDCLRSIGGFDEK